MAVKITFAGLTFLYTKPVRSDLTLGEIALLDPAAEKAHPDDLRGAGSHLPLLVVKSADVQEVTGEDVRFPLDGAIQGSWVGARNGDLSPFRAWSLKGATVNLLNDNQGDLTVKKKGREPARTAEGCKDKPEDWSHMEWIPKSNNIAPGLELAPYWRTSPHIAARFVLGNGTISSTDPVEVNSGLIPIRFFPDDQFKVYSDAMLYEKPVADATLPALVISREGSRTLIRFDSSNVNCWILSLDDPQHSTPSFEHFNLYSLLPWRFRTPKMSATSCTGQNLTSGECFGLWHEAEE